MVVHPAKLWLLASGLSVTQLARRIGRSRTYTSQVLNGHERPSKNFMAAVARELDAPIELLFDPPKGEKEPA